MYEIVIIFSYVFIGIGMKYVDQTFDEKMWNPSIAIILSIMGGILFGLLSFFDVPYSTILLGSILFVVYLTRKVDNIGFKIGFYIAFVLFAVSFLYIYFTLNFSLYLIISFFVLVTAGILDEILNDYYDKKYTFSTLQKFLHTRPNMRIALLIFCVMGWIPFLYFICLFLLDLMYYLIDVYSRYLQIKRWYYVHT